MRGFSLIELMIAVAIVGIIAAVAIPSYQAQSREARRADAAGVLMQARQAMERHYSKNYSYAAGAAAGTTFSAKSPIDGSATYYNLTLVSNATTFTITATPAGSQATDSCGAIAINQAGQKGAKGKAPGAASAAEVEECW